MYTSSKMFTVCTSSSLTTKSHFEDMHVKVIINYIYQKNNNEKAPSSALISLYKEFEKVKTFSLSFSSE